MKKTVVIGLLGPTLDRAIGKYSERWLRWRPTISICQHEDLLIDRFELLYQDKFEKLANQVKSDIGTCSPETTVMSHYVDFEDPWDFEQVYTALHDFTKAYPFNTDEEDYLIHITTGTHVAQICLFLLTESNYLPGKILQTSPAKTRGTYRPATYSIIDLDLSKYDLIASRFKQEINDDISFLKSGIETKNKAFNNLITQIEKVAIHSIEPLLLMGPTGAGKSQLARRIYELKKTRTQISGPFIEINCATIRGDAALSTLFGHKKGAFTGALQDREGLLRAANNGMLFLDEVGELGLDEQAMLLRAIEEKRFMPMGCDCEVESSFLLICGTNKNLHKEVDSGKFREDLLARINLWTFHLPGLCHRREDIEPNINYELERFIERYKINVSFNKEAKKSYLDFANSNQATWKANFRDLSASITRMATLSAGGRITKQTVVEEQERLLIGWQTKEENTPDNTLNKLLPEEQIEALDYFDKLQLEPVLKICAQSKSLSEAGRTLFSNSRSKKKSTNDADRLRKYLSRYNISWSHIHKEYEQI